MNKQTMKSLLIPMLLVTIMLTNACGDRAVKPVDLANPADESLDSTELSNDLDYSDESGVFPDSTDFEFLDSTITDSSGILNAASVDTAAVIDIPVGSSLKKINAVFNSVNCDKSSCSLVFKTESDEELIFCGAYGDFLKADFRSANPNLIGKNFMIIYRAQTIATKDSIQKDSKIPCNSIVFAKPL